MSFVRRSCRFVNARTPQGWRVEIQESEDSRYLFYFEDYRAISFDCTISVDGSMFIYLGEPSRWASDYPWAALRRHEIVTRVAQVVIAPGRVADINDEKGYIIVRKESKVV